ncbi:hypothetical protein quinque_006749 [Culex quinquefasciatus]
MDDDWFGPGIDDPYYDDWLMSPQYEADYLDWCKRKCPNKPQTAESSSVAAAKKTPANTKNDSTLFVRNLSQSVTNQVLATLFARFGTLTNR